MCVKTSKMDQAAAGLDLQLADNSENTVHFFLARDVDKRRARSGLETAVDRIVAGIEAHTAYLIGTPYRVVGRTRYRRFGKR